MHPNKMKAKLAAGDPALGLSLMIPSPQLVEMAGGVGFDWVLIDCEHGTITLETVELMIMAAEASGVTPIVRPRSNNAQDIVEVMDRGAAGVQVPHVVDGAAARAAVEASSIRSAAAALRLVLALQAMATAVRRTISSRKPIARRSSASRSKTRLQSTTSMRFSRLRAWMCSSSGLRTCRNRWGTRATRRRSRSRKRLIGPSRPS